MQCTVTVLGKWSTKLWEVCGALASASIFAGVRVAEALLPRAAEEDGLGAGALAAVVGMFRQLPIDQSWGQQGAGKGLHVVSFETARRAVRAGGRSHTCRSLGSCVLKF